MTSINLATLHDVAGGSFAKDWWPDIKAGAVPGVAGAVAGAACFGGVSLAAGGSFFVPPAAPVAVAIGAQAASFGCGAIAATVTHHFMSKTSK